MPTVGVFEDDLKVALGGLKVEDAKFESAFDELCFEFGLELDEVTSDFEMMRKERGEEAASGASKRVIYKIDVPANRYDLLCLEGLVLALQVFKGMVANPQLSLSMPHGLAATTMYIAKETAGVRPYILCAILRGVTLNKSRYDSFIDLQEKVMSNVGRKRQLVAIGTHDLDSIKGPFRYEARAPTDIEFQSLFHDEKMTAEKLMKSFETHQQIKQYVPIIKDSPVYPVIYDSNREVLSMPPIINGSLSKISLETKDIFIELTGMDQTKCEIALNCMIAGFAQYCTTPFQVEPVQLVFEEGSVFSGETLTYPKVAPRRMIADAARMKKSLTLDKLTNEEVCTHLTRMGIPSKVDQSCNNILNCEVPVTRSDVMHECDLIEDLAISYGYNNLTEEVPFVQNVPMEQPINHITDLTRTEFACAGFTECLNWGLQSKKENHEWLQREPASKPDQVQNVDFEYQPFGKPVTIANPKTKEFEVLRTTLLSGLLKTVAHNKMNPPPIRVFEVSDIVLQDGRADTETGAKNRRQAAAVACSDKNSQFEVVHGLLDQILWKLNCEQKAVLENPNSEEGKLARKRHKLAYHLEPSQDPAFLPGRQAHVMVNGVKIGVMGIIHPDVLKSFEISLPCSAFEFNLEPFLTWLTDTAK
mmetsp:Transcript_23920/g.58032  ORF Transcript_23920/g.58032 Transcript_23920/m.58032 type:complete len:645 (-) Transcript_23920:176-2110(-)